MILGLESLMKGPGGGHGGGSPSGGGDHGGGRGFGPGGRGDQGGGGPSGEGGGFGPGGRADQGGGTGPSIVAQAAMSPVAAAILASQAGGDQGQDTGGAFGPGGIFAAGPSPTGTDFAPPGGGGAPTPGGPFAASETGDAGEGGGPGGGPSGPASGIPAMATGPAWARGQAFTAEGGGGGRSFESAAFTRGVSVWSDPGQAAGLLVNSVLNLTHSFSGNRFYFTTGLWTPPVIALVVIVSLFAFSGRSAR